jgi:hypothetical protein
LHGFVFAEIFYMKVEYLGEFETTLTLGSGAQIELFVEKTEGRKSRDRVPLSTSYAGTTANQLLNNSTIFVLYTVQIVVR